MDHPWRVKQRRADEHLLRFADDCDAYVEAAHVGFGYETDPVAGTIKVRLQADSEPPASLGATIGDVLHNLRSALDAVAWAACKRAGVPAKREHLVYFPIGVDPAAWDDLAARRLPSVDPQQVEVFEQLQPWYWHAEAKKVGVDVDVIHSAEAHALARLNRLARIDRHQVPHLVLARAGHTWLGHDEGVQVDVVGVNYWTAQPGDVVLEWRVDPPGSVSDVQPDGEAILALSEEGARNRQTALDELRAMQQAVVQAIRTVEIEVLEVVSPADLEGFGRLDRAFREARDTLQSLILSEHVIDEDYIERHRRAVAVEKAARTAYLARWRELFD